MNSILENSILEIDRVLDVDDKGIARIAGTRLKVAQLALEHSRQGQTPEQISESHSLSPAQVQAALEYYHSHRENIEAQISASLTYADQAREEAGPSDLAAKLKAAKRQKERQPA